MNKPSEIVRSAAQIQHAHDLLVTVLFDEQLQEELMSDDAERRISIECINASASVLCWLLGHPNRNFANNLIKLEGAVIAAGYEMRRVEVEGEEHGPLPS